MSIHILYSSSGLTISSHTVEMMQVWNKSLHIFTDAACNAAIFVKILNLAIIVTIKKDILICWNFLLSIAILLISPKHLPLVEVNAKSAWLWIVDCLLCSSPGFILPHLGDLGLIFWCRSERDCLRHICQKEPNYERKCEKEWKK